MPVLSPAIYDFKHRVQTTPSSSQGVVAGQVAYGLAVTALPAEFTGIFTADPYRVVKNWHICICVVSGLWGGLIIGIVTEYYTSNRYTPVQARCVPSSQAMLHRNRTQFTPVTPRRIGPVPFSRPPDLGHAFPDMINSWSLCCQ